MTTVKTYNNLPTSIKTDALILLVHKAAAKKTNRPAYQQALNTLFQHHGDNNHLSFLFVDYHLYNGDFTNAHAALDSFAMRTQWDAALYTLKASIAYYQQQYLTAIKYCRHAINNNKNYEQAYFLLLDSLVFKALYDDATLVLTILEKRFSYDFEPDKLAQITGYIDFVNSKQFAKWTTSTY